MIRLPPPSPHRPLPTTPPGPRHDRDARPVGPGRSGLAALALGALLVLAGCGRGDRGRVLILGIDGLDPATVDLLMSEGEMPNLARMRQEGAYGEVICPKPLLSPILWTTIATGRSPAARPAPRAINQPTPSRTKNWATVKIAVVRVWASGSAAPARLRTRRQGRVT